MVSEIESLNINNVGKGCWCFISHSFILVFVFEGRKTQEVGTSAQVGLEAVSGFTPLIRCSGFASNQKAPDPSTTQSYVKINPAVNHTPVAGKYLVHVNQKRKQSFLYVEREREKRVGGWQGD